MIKPLQRTRIGIAAIFVVIASSPVLPQDIDIEQRQPIIESKTPDIENGRTLASKLCSGCHLTGEPANAAAPVDVPTFSNIASRPSQSTDKLSNWLMAPHAPMPDPHLSRIEIRDLTGYILSLRKLD